jgi:hypothetical protein
MEEELSIEEKMKLLDKVAGALEWIKLSEPLDKRLERIEEEFSHI